MNFKKIKKNSYQGNYEKYKFVINYNHSKSEDKLRWLEHEPQGWLNIEEIETQIMEEYIKFRENEK